MKSTDFQKKKLIHLLILCMVSLIVLFLYNPVYPQPKQPPPSPKFGSPIAAPGEEGSPVERIGPDEYRVGKLTLNKKKRQIYIPGKVNMQTGLVEYLACWEKTGKLHESVLKVEPKPSDVQVALLLLGTKRENNLKFQGDPNIPKGDPLTVWVEWDLPDKTKKRVRGEELVYDQKNREPMEQTEWSFTGSLIHEGNFVANIEGSIVAVFRDPVAIINNPLPSGADDTRFFCNEKLLPPVETKVLLIIQPIEKENQ